MKDQTLTQIAGVVLLVAWLGFLGFLINGALHDAPDARWTRFLAIQSSFEAVVFAVVGALFGTQVQQKRVTEAKDEAKKAQERAKEVEKTAQERQAEAVRATANGRALAAGVVAEAEHGAKARAANAGEGTGLAPLAEMARRLFPD